MDSSGIPYLSGAIRLMAFFAAVGVVSAFVGTIFGLWWLVGHISVVVR